MAGREVGSQQQWFAGMSAGCVKIGAAPPSSRVFQECRCAVGDELNNFVRLSEGKV